MGLYVGNADVNGKRWKYYMVPNSKLDFFFMEYIFYFILFCFDLFNIERKSIGEIHYWGNADVD